MTTIPASGTESTIRFLDGLFASVPLAKVSFRLWDGTQWPDDRSRPATLVLHHPGALRAMFSSGTEQGLAEAFLRDDFDIAGDIEAAFELADILENRAAPNWRTMLANYFRLRRLPVKPGPRPAGRAFGGRRGRRHSLERDRRAVSFHYDVSNDFFRLWLDRHLLYSCAYFEQAEDDLDTAQAAKLRHLCRKLRLRPGQRVLDIGCGWGGFALFAARTCGVEVTGVTLSQRQAELATALANDAGLAREVKIKLRDYRELPESEAYDAIVSVGMSEHVGAERLADYFQKASRMLKSGGVFLNHAIGEGARPRRRRGPSFIEKYVFPDGDIPPIPAVLHAAESAGLEVRDVENLREHYALTLRHWVRRLEANHGPALAFVNEATYRVWRLYMTGSAHGFVRGQLAVYQVLLAKPDRSGNSHLPLTRRDWYA
jgi:cyclopropane-fatty-acyl-phospholipid synthase